MKYDPSYTQPPASAFRISNQCAQRRKASVDSGTAGSGTDVGRAAWTIGVVLGRPVADQSRGGNFLLAGRSRGAAGGGLAKGRGEVWPPQRLQPRPTSSGKRRDSARRQAGASGRLRPALDAPFFSPPPAAPRARPASQSPEQKKPKLSGEGNKPTSSVRGIKAYLAVLGECHLGQAREILVRSERISWPSAGFPVSLKRPMCRPAGAPDLGMGANSWGSHPRLHDAVPPGL